MSSSLLIKGLDGAVNGYALVSGGRLYIRISGLGKGMNARIGHGEKEMSVQIDGAGAEQVFRWDEDGEMEWIVLECNGKVWALGGNVPENACRNYASRDEQEEETHKNTQMQSTCAERKVRSTDRLGERRWPPPPCWPSACYLDGEWKEVEARA